jgi:hypothetical protein
MRYKGFIVIAFERQPGKWRARIVRRNAKLSRSARHRIFATSADLPSQGDALTWAMEAIDAGTFSRNTEAGMEGLRRKRRTIARSGDLGRRAFVFDEDEVVQLLRAAVDREGSQIAFAERHAIDRANISAVLNGKRRISGPLVKALGLRKVYEQEASERRTRSAGWPSSGAAKVKDEEAISLLAVGALRRQDGN